MHAMWLLLQQRASWTGLAMVAGIVLGICGLAIWLLLTDHDKKRKEREP